MRNELVIDPTRCIKKIWSQSNSFRGSYKQCTRKPQGVSEYCAQHDPFLIKQREAERECERLALCARQKAQQNRQAKASLAWDNIELLKARIAELELTAKVDDIYG